MYIAVYIMATAALKATNGRRWKHPDTHENLTYSIYLNKAASSRKKTKNYQEGFTVSLRLKIAAPFCDAGWLSAEQHSSYFHRCRGGTHCSRAGGESTR